MIELDVQGAKEIERKLKSLEPKLARKIVRQSLRKAAKPILKKAKENCPVATGELKKNLKVRALKKRKHSYAVQAGTSKGWYKGDQFYAGFIEFGTVNMEPKPFMRPAFDSEKENSQKILISELLSGIKEASK